MKWNTGTLLVLSALGPALLNATPYSAYQVGPVCQPSQEIRAPKSDKEVVSTVREAILKGLTVKAFGIRHSVTDVICTDGIPLDMKNFQKKVLNPDGSATFGSGVIMNDVGEFLKSKGRALKTMPAFGNITIGGATGTGAHGTTVKYHSTVSDQVIGLTIVDGLGIVRKISDETSLKAFRTHLGLLGIVLDITLKTVPFYKVLAHNYEISDEIFLDERAEDIIRAIDEPLLLWFPILNKVIVYNWTNVDQETEGSAHASLVSTSSQAQNLQGNINLEALLSLPEAQSAAIINSSQATSYKAKVQDGFVGPDPIYTEDGFTVKNPAVGDWHKMVASTCPKEGPIQCTFIPEMGDAQTKVLESEFAIPLANLGQFVQRLKHIVSITPAAFLPNGIVLRFSPATDTYMALSQGRETVHVGFYKLKRTNEYTDPSPWLAAYQTLSQSMTDELKGRSHWGKSAPAYHTRGMIDKKLDPWAKTAFLLQRKLYDPLGIFLNSFGKRLLGISDKIDTDPKTEHCALLDICVCRTNNDCADSQVCGNLDGYNYNVCK